MPRCAPAIGAALLAFLLAGCSRPHASLARVDLLASLAEAERRGTPALANGRLSLPPESSVGFYLQVPGDARLELAIADGETPASLVVSIRDDEEDATLLAPLPARPAASRAADLARWAGRLARLEVAHAGGPGRVWIERLEITSPAEARPPADGAAGGAPPLDFRPNIVIYLVDTLRADRLGAYGYERPTSPRFDAFARESLLFEDTWAQASWTRPTVASVLTGLHPAVHGADRPDRRLGGHVVTLAEVLKAQGYRTGAFVANHLVSRRTGVDQGFDEWNDGEEKLYGAPSEEYGARALAWIARGSTPFFAYVHTMDPHAPYAPPAWDAAPYAVPYAGERDTMALLRRGLREGLHPRARRYLEAQYLGEVRRNDRAFGAFIDGLRGLGLLDRSVVLFTADHGEEFWDHGGTQHGRTLYAEQLRIPLAVRLPGARRGGTRERGIVEQIDLYPTLLRLAGSGPARRLPGRDLSAWWIEGRPARPPPWLHSEQRFTVVDKAAVRCGDLKLILNRDDRRHWRSGSELELYDLARDPSERSNLAAARPIAVACLRQELDRFARRATPSDAAGDALLPLTRDDLEQLRAMGYVQ